MVARFSVGAFTSSTRAPSDFSSSIALSTRLSTTDELPSIAANRSLEPSKLSGLVRGELDWVVMKALEKDRNCRYETANSLALDLQRYLHDQPIVARPTSRMERSWRWCRRNQAVALLLA